MCAPRCLRVQGEVRLCVDAYVCWSPIPSPRRRATIAHSVTLLIAVMAAVCGVRCVLQEHGGLGVALRGGSVELCGEGVSEENVLEPQQAQVPSQYLRTRGECRVRKYPVHDGWVSCV